MEHKLGKYIVIEGHDGTGKSTQVNNLRNRLKEAGIDSIEFHEPAGNPIADQIRNILKNGKLERDPITNVFLFSAARHELWVRRAIPALKLGKFVVTARNYYSTLAYQGYGENVDLDFIEEITNSATDERYLKPDLLVILDLDNEKERVRRIDQRGEIEVPDTFESKNDDYQSRVCNGYLEIAKNKDIPVISANQSEEKITDDLWEYVKKLI